MQVYKTRAFKRWAQDENLLDTSLCKAINEMNQGLIDATLGGFVFKKRIGIGGQGKSSGLRTLIAFKIENKAFFIYGFAKNVRANIKPDELKALKKLAKALFNYTDLDLEKAMNVKELIKVICNEEINT